MRRNIVAAIARSNRSRRKSLRETCTPSLTGFARLFVSWQPTWYGGVCHDGCDLSAGKVVNSYLRHGLHIECLALDGQQIIRRAEVQETLSHVLVGNKQTGFTSCYVNAVDGRRAWIGRGRQLTYHDER